jgi:hypothetical protein
VTTSNVKILAKPFRHADGVFYNRSTARKDRARQMGTHAAISPCKGSCPGSAGATDELHAW